MRLTCSPGSFIITPLTPRSEITAWLRKQWFVHSEAGAERWLWWLLGMRRVLYAMRVDYLPSLPPHAHGHKVLFTKGPSGNEMFIKRIIITNFTAEEVFWGYVSTDAGRHQFDLEFEEGEEEEKAAWTQCHDTEEVRGLREAISAAWRWLVRVTVTNWRRG